MNGFNSKKRMPWLILPKMYLFVFASNTFLVLSLLEGKNVGWGCSCAPYMGFGIPWWHDGLNGDVTIACLLALLSSLRAFTLLRSSDSSHVEPYQGQRALFIPSSDISDRCAIDFKAAGTHNQRPENLIIGRLGGSSDKRRTPDLIARGVWSRHAPRFTARPNSDASVQFNMPAAIEREVCSCWTRGLESSPSYSQQPFSGGQVADNKLYKLKFDDSRLKYEGEWWQLQLWSVVIAHVTLFIPRRLLLRNCSAE